MKAAALTTLLIALSGTANATAPRAPFAAGPLENIFKVARMATQCGVHRLRLESGPGWATPSHARLFYDQPISPVIEHCVTHWTTKEGKRLGLEPRWWGDTFESDTPKEARPR